MFLEKLKKKMKKFWKQKISVENTGFFPIFFPIKSNTQMLLDAIERNKTEQNRTQQYWAEQNTTEQYYTILYYTVLYSTIYYIMLCKKKIKKGSRAD